MCVYACVREAFLLLFFFDITFSSNSHGTVDAPAQVYETHMDAFCATCVLVVAFEFVGTEVATRYQKNGQM